MTEPNTVQQQRLWEIVTLLLGESREKDGRPVVEAVTIGGQEMTITVEAHQPANLDV